MFFLPLSLRGFTVFPLFISPLLFVPFPFLPFASSPAGTDDELYSRRRASEIANRRQKETAENPQEGNERPIRHVQEEYAHHPTRSGMWVVD